MPSSTRTGAEQARARLFALATGRAARPILPEAVGFYFCRSYPEICIGAAAWRRDETMLCDGCAKRKGWLS